MPFKQQQVSAEAPTQDLVQMAMRINLEAGSVHAWLFLKRHGFRDEEIFNLLLHTPTLRVVH